MSDKHKYLSGRDSDYFCEFRLSDNAVCGLGRYHSIHPLAEPHPESEPSASAESTPEQSSDECVGERCWYNSETGYTEYCSKHDAIMADRAMEAEEKRKNTPPEQPSELRITQPIPCPTCRAPIFTRSDKSVVAHYNGEGLKCAASETVLTEPTVSAQSMRNQAVSDVNAAWAFPYRQQSAIKRDQAKWEYAVAQRELVLSQQQEIQALRQALKEFKSIMQRGQMLTHLYELEIKVTTLLAKGQPNGQ
jgi:hypothetical protein